MKRWILIFLIFLLSATLVGALRVELKVSPKIDANSLLSFQANQSNLQQFYLILENVGSVSCKSRGRLEFYNKSSNETYLTYIAWSPKFSLPPAALARWNFHTHLPNGSYEFLLVVEHCFRQFEKGPFNLSIAHQGREERGVIEIEKVRVFRDHIEVFVKSQREVENITLIPASYPFGWVFESARIEEIEAGKVAKARIGYEPSVWEEANVTFHAINADGSFFDERVVKLKLEEGILERIFKFLSWLVGKLAGELRY